MGLPYHDPFEVDPLTPDDAVADFDPTAIPDAESFIAEMEAEALAQQMPMPASAPMGAPLPAQTSAIDPHLEEEIMGVPGGGIAPQEVAPGPAEPLAPEVAPAMPVAPEDLQPDMVSSAAEMSFYHDETEGSDFMTPTGDLGGQTLEAPDGDRYEGELPAEDLPAAVGLDEYTDEGLLQQQFEAKQADEAERQRLAREEAAEDAQRKLENAKIYQDRQAEADAKAEDLIRQSKEIADQRVNPDRYTENMNWGEKALAAFAIIAGGQLGLMSGRGGNDALQFFMAEINADIEQQKYDIENSKDNLATQKGLVAELYRKNGDAYEAAEVARMAMYEAATAEIDSKMAKLNPEGTQAIEAELHKRQLASAASANKARVLEHQRKIGMENAKFDLDARDTQSQIRKRAEETKKLEAETAKLKRRRGRGRPKAPSIHDIAKAESIGWVSDGRGGWLKDPNWVKPEKDKSAQERMAEKELEMFDQERVRTLGVGGLENKDGTPLLASSPTEAAKMSDLKAATDDATELIDEIIMMRETKGGEYFKTEAGRAIQSKHSQVLSKLGTVEGWGALSDGDLQLGLNFTGTSDPNEYRSYKKALLGLRQDIVDKTNHRLKAIGRGQAKHYEPPRKDRKTEYQTTLNDKVSLITEGIPKVTQEDPVLLDQALRQKRAAAEDIANNYSPEYGTMRGAGEAIHSQIESGELPHSFAMEVVVPMGERMMSRIREQVQNADTVQLLELQEDPEYLEEITLLKEAGDNPTSEQLYKLVTGKRPLSGKPKAKTYTGIRNKELDSLLKAYK